jgi:nucleoside-diphosphate-sugar epimerase
MRISLYTKSNQMLIDAAIAAAAWGAAYLIRYEGVISRTTSRQMLVLLLPVAIGQVLTSSFFGIYRFQWRYVNTGDALCVARAYLAYSFLVIGSALLAGPATPLLHVPLSIIATMSVLSLVGAISARLARRVLYERRAKAIAPVGPQRFLIIGAGAHGAMVAREMLLRKGIEVIGFLDDDPGKQGAVIAGITVLGRIADLPNIAQTTDIDEVLVCISPKSRQSLRISDAKTSKGIPVRSRIMPTLEEILQANSVISVLSGVNEPPGNDGQLARSVKPGRAVKSAAPNPAEPMRFTPDGHHSSGNSNGHGKANGNSHGKGGQRLLHSVASRHTMANVIVSPLRNKTILITGGAGFIGSSLAEKVVEHNRVILFDQSFECAPIQYTSLLRHRNVASVQGSILEADLRRLVKDVDIVVHAAAILGVNRVCNSSRETLETNYVGTSRLLKALDTTCKIQRFVYFSTSEVFGVNSYRVDEASRPSIGPIAESRWCYAMSKLAGEHLVASYFRETQLPITVVRPFNIFGPRRTGDYALRRFILNALQGKPLEIHGDGTQIRSWCYIEDFCSALLQMMARPEAVGEDFNIGHPGNVLTVYELAQKVIQLARSTSDVTFCESPFPDISIRVPSLEKARRLLGYEPKYDLNTGLKLTIEWHQANFNLFQQRAFVPAAAAPTLLGQESAA